MKPLVSIVIPCFNQGVYLPECLQSVQDQQYDNIEVIIINDGSTEAGTLKILKEINDPRILIHHQINKGLSLSRNKGIALAKGEYILPLDADDIIHPGYVDKAISIFSEHPGVRVVYGGAEFIGNRKGPWELPSYTVKGMLTRNLIYCSALFRRKDFLETRGYDPGMTWGWEDWDLWLQLIKDESEVYKMTETVFYYRIKDESMVKEIDKDEQKRKYLEQQLVSNHIKLYRTYYPEPLTLIRELNALREEKTNYEKYLSEVRNSASYRIGNILLLPAKMIRKLLTKKLN